MGHNNESVHYPSADEYLATGLLGIFIYSLIAYLSASSISFGIRSKSTKRFFLCMIFLAILELPRFVVMCIQRSYTSRVAYSFHLLAGIFFFVAFSIVCRQWSGLLQLGSYFRAVYGLHGLILSNISFAVVDIVAVVACLTCSSLHSFFQSTEFIVITFIEGVRNVVYSTFLSYYGVKLVRRFWHFSILERRAAVHKSIFMYICACCSPDSFVGSSSSSSRRRAWQQRGSSSRLARLAGQEDVAGGNGDEHHDDDDGVAITGFGQSAAGRPPVTAEAVFTKVVLRMTTVLVLSSLCFMLRVVMLITKMIALHSDRLSLSTHNFPLFGMLWFTFSDFLPRALPSLAFIFLMRTKRPAKQMRDNVQHKQVPGREDFQFVPLSGFDDSLDADVTTGRDPVTGIIASDAAGDATGGAVEDPFTLSATGADAGIVGKSEVMLKADFLNGGGMPNTAQLLQYDDLSRAFAHSQGRSCSDDEDEEGDLGAAAAEFTSRWDDLYEYNPQQHRVPLTDDVDGRSRSSSRSSRNRTPVDFSVNDAVPEEPHSFEDTVVDNILSIVTFGAATTETIGSRPFLKQQHHDVTSNRKGIAITQQSSSHSLKPHPEKTGSGGSINLLGRLKNNWGAAGSSNSNGRGKGHAVGDIEASNLQDNNYSI